MNEDEQKIDQKLIDAYNAGYLLQQYEPALLQKMVSGENKKNDFVNAMDAGGRQHVHEKMKQEQQQKRDNIIAEQQRQHERQQQKKLNSKR